MNRRGWILFGALLAMPSPVAGQALDSVQAHALALTMAEDIRSLSDAMDLRYIRHGLPSIEAFFGIEFERPDMEADGRDQVGAHLVEIYRVHGADSLLAEAVRFEDRQGGMWPRTGMALETIARQEGPVVALEAARVRDLLASDMPRILNGAGLRRLDEVLSWIDEADIEVDLRLRLRAHALGFGSAYEPFRFWQRAEGLPEPHRTEVRVRALSTTAGSDTIPSHVLEVELPTMMEVARSLEGVNAAAVMRGVAATCGRREIEACADFDLPVHDEGGQTRMDVINLTGSGAFGQAERLLESLRGMDPPLVVARLMAQGLESLGRNCPMADCDLVQIDSLAAAWTDEILAAEADALAGRIERTATWNGRDDLTELQRALGNYLSARDLQALREVLGRMEDPAAIAHVLQSLIPPASPVDLLEAVDIYLTFAPAGHEPSGLPYTALLAAGRPDLAERMLERAGPMATTHALVTWIQHSVRAGRTEDARAALRTLMAESDYQFPVGIGELLRHLESVRMLDDYLDHVLTLPTPQQRLHGVYPLVLAWVQRAGLTGGAPSH